MTVRLGVLALLEAKPARVTHSAFLEAGQIPQTLAQVGPDLLAADPDIRAVEIVAVK
ncbi:MAG: hypothetical protein QOG98_2027 [Pseudonocardiales bacterium]|nr:hypothetical protein [Pseudonocardiales bacterium]